MKNSIMWLNLIALAATIYVNYLANALPINGLSTGELSAMYPNKFVPAGFTFAIWGIIYLAVTGWVIYFLIPSNQAKYQKSGVGYWFVISSILNISWILAWHYKVVALSVVIMLGLLYSITRIYLALRQANLPKALTYPFSIYLGWICVATIANTTTLLVYMGIDGGSYAVYYATVMILAAVILGLFFNLAKKDVLVSFVIIWALYGIYSRHDDTTIQVACMVGMLSCGLLGFITLSHQGRLIGSFSK